MPNVRALLEQVGMARLRVKSAVMKAQLTHIAKTGETYLRQQANGSEPSGGQIVPLVDQLEILLRVVDRHVTLESVTDYSSAKQRQLLASLDAVKKFASSINVQQRSVVGTIMDDVDLQLLIRQTRSNH